MIVRIVAVDPQGVHVENKGRKTETDLIVWQVPEKSRALGLLTELLDNAGIEWAQIGGKEKQD